MHKVTVLQASRMPPEGESARTDQGRSPLHPEPHPNVHLAAQRGIWNTHKRAPAALPSSTAGIFFASFVSSQVGNGDVKQAARKAGKRNLKNKTPCTANSRVSVAAAEVGFYSMLLYHLFFSSFFFNARVLHALRSNCPITKTPSKKARKNKKAERATKESYPA